jgi:DNA polymerase-3 subunit gamma/tau
MVHQALYRQYRPQTFDDVVEQQHVVKTLKNTVKSKKTTHAYLFCGTRGTGKTTIAKIFARAVNCLHPEDGNPCNKCDVCMGIINGTILDVAEIDAASNNSVDNVRNIIDEVVYTPTRASKKFYIIDEVHMLSTGAFNALLKTLEEPPEHVMFILATTEPHKLPATVLSRCQRFDFRRITIEGIAERLLKISNEMSVSITGEAVYFIASLSEGALRDGISILDQCIATGKSHLDISLVQEVVGSAPEKFVLETVRALTEARTSEAINSVDRLFLEGKDSGQFLQKIIQILRDVLVFKSTNKTENLLSITDEEKNSIPELAKNISLEETMAIVRQLSELEAVIKWSTSPRILLEMAFMRICLREFNTDESSLSERIGMLEARLRILEEKIAQSHTGRIDTGNKEKKETVRKSVKAENTEKTLQPDKSDVKPDISQGVFKQWDKVKEALKNKGKMAVITNLEGTSAVWADNDIVDIIVPEDDSFKNRMLSRKDSIEAISEAVKTVTGIPTEVRIVKSGQAAAKEGKKDMPDKFVRFAERNGLKLDIIDE